MTAPLHGPLEWRRIVQWLREDGVIAVEEAQRTVARLAQAESSQHPLGASLAWRWRAPAMTSRWILRH